MNNALKLISINIEGSKHLTEVTAFVREQRPDVVCLQEVFESDFPQIKTQLQMEGTWVPIAYVKQNRPGNNGDFEKWGIAILSRLPLNDVLFEYYFRFGNEDTPHHVLHVHNSLSRAILWGKVTKDGQQFTVATTHFTWALGMEATDEQKRDLISLKKVLTQIPEIILCGDFNAPRGGAVFTELSQMYQDNIPADITTTIDQNLHKVKGIQYVVDVLFTSAEYQVKNVQVVCDVSDHCAVVGEIERVKPLL